MKNVADFADLADMCPTMRISLYLTDDAIAKLYILYWYMT